jgi:hypothetical protein
MNPESLTCAHGYGKKGFGSQSGFYCILNLQCAEGISAGFYEQGRNGFTGCPSTTENRKFSLSAAYHHPAKPVCKPSFQRFRSGA